MEVYVDDMLVKSKKAADHIRHLGEAFDILRKYQMKLNPKKCSFGVSAGKFLGYIVSFRGIEANPAKIKALLDLSPPRTIKEVQSLNGRVTALTRFISRSTDKCRPFFQILKGDGRLEWNDECEQAFAKLKEYLGKPPVLAKPLEGETLFLYLAVSEYAVSAVLVREEERNHQPIYYVSKALIGPETRYSGIEKLALALVIAAKKLRPYFLAHSIVVLTNYPLRKAIQKAATSRVALWGLQLSEYDIDYRPRTAIKAQALADFISEFSKEEPVIITPEPEVGALLPTEFPEDT